MKNFLEKNYKIITGILLIIGIILMLKLLLVGFNTGGCGGGWINICIVPSMEYYFISASYIALLFLGISIYLIHIINKTQNNTSKIFIALFILFLGLIGKQVFFIVSPDFKFYLNKAEYKDENNKLVDIDKYLEQVTKYCIDDGEFDFYTNREGMCGGKFEPDLKTVEEYIKVFESAKKNDFKYLYYLTYRFADENVGLENIIEKYNDDTFYAIVIKNNRTDNLYINLIIDNTKNNDLKILINSIISDNKHYFEQNLNSGKDKYDNWDNFRDKIEIKINEGIKQIPEINQKIF